MILAIYLVLHFTGLLVLIWIDPAKKHPRHHREASRGHHSR